MTNVNFNLTLNRHSNNGSTRMTGRVGNENVDVSVSRNTTDGNAVVDGDWGQRDNVDFTFYRDASQGYNRIAGELRGQDVRARLRRGQDGDTSMTKGRERFEIDRDRTGENVSLRGSKVGGGFRRARRDGDESGELRTNERIGFEIDRDPRSGDFEISGRSSAGRFNLRVDRTGRDGDLKMTGTLPAGSEDFPLLWEILGDDKNIPDNVPFYPGSLLGMSMFLADSTKA